MCHGWRLVWDAWESSEVRSWPRLFHDYSGREAQPLSCEPAEIERVNRCPLATVKLLLFRDDHTTMPFLLAFMGLVSWPRFADSSVQFEQVHSTSSVRQEGVSTFPGTGGHIHTHAQHHSREGNDPKCMPDGLANAPHLCPQVATLFLVFVAHHFRKLSDTSLLKH